MTTAQLATYYANLLILQYIEKPKAYAMIKALVTPVFIDQLPIDVQNAFNIEDAEGVQLDTLGDYVGVSRNGYTLSGPVSLSDTDYRILMKMVIIKNSSGSSLATIQSLLAAAFPGFIYVSDSQSMSLNYTIIETLGTPDLLEILVTGGYLPAPMGVQVSATIIPDLEFPFFGFVTYSDPTPTNPPSPFNNYPFYQLTYPWLSYKGVS